MEDDFEFEFDKPEYDQFWRDLEFHEYTKAVGLE